MAWFKRVKENIATETQKKELPDGMWTLAIYSASGDVIYTLNDSQSGSGRFTVSLALGLGPLPCLISLKTKPLLVVTTVPGAAMPVLAAGADAGWACARVALNSQASVAAIEGVSRRVQARRFVMVRVGPG